MHEIYAFQYIMDIPLLIPDNRNILDLKDLLDFHFKSEIIEFEAKCLNCDKISIQEKKLKISHPPILTMQRLYANLNTKNNCLIKIKELLDISDYIDKDCFNNTVILYDLYGVVNHIGSLSRGHYYTFIKIFDKNIWYKFNDVFNFLLFSKN